MGSRESTETLSMPSNHHQIETDDEDENVKQLQECSILYQSLQECLAQTNRNWKSCQLGPFEIRGAMERA